MKKVGFFVLLFGLSAFAQSNPLIRICNVTEGQFHEIFFSDDQVAFCQYGLAMIDSLTVLEVTSNETETLAVKALKSSADTCALANGRLKQGLSSDQVQFNFCEFKDGSMIELSTLKSGSSAPSNAGLMKALNTRF